MNSGCVSSIGWACRCLRRVSHVLYVPHPRTLMVIMQSGVVGTAAAYSGTMSLGMPCSRQHNMQPLSQERGTCTFTHSRFIQPACWCFFATLETGSACCSRCDCHLSTATTNDHRSYNHTVICLGYEGKQKVHSRSRSQLESGHQVHPNCCWDLWRLVCGCHQYHQSDWSSTLAKDGIFPNWCYLSSFSEACSQPLKGQRLHVDRQNFYFSSQNWQCNLICLFCFEGFLLFLFYHIWVSINATRLIIMRMHKLIVRNAHAFTRCAQVIAHV